jgi:Protein of unknown function (DUF2809)
MKTKLNYFVLAMALLATEVYIALYVRDTFIRPIFGDFLAVVFLYCLLKSVSNKSVLFLSFCSLLVAYLLETLQYFQFLQVTGLNKYHFLKLLIGSAFAWSDMVAYTLGFTFVLIIEKITKPAHEIVRK